MTGPLHGVRVVELAGIGPGPFAAMLLADSLLVSIKSSVNAPMMPLRPA